MTKAPSHRKKGPGRRHVQGEPQIYSPERDLYFNKMARKAYRGQVAIKHP